LDPLNTRCDEWSSSIKAMAWLHGLEGLRVADCPILPDVVAGNTNAASIATAWRASEPVLQDNA